jgi:hypothetical protein
MKHVGKMKNNSARVAVVYRTLPGDSENALVVGTQGLSDSHHDSLMSLIESDQAQQSGELADILAVRRFPDGSAMLSYLHTYGHLKKVPTKMVLMTPTPQTSIPLDELNRLIADQMGVSIEELAVRDDNGQIVKSNKKKVVTAVIEESSVNTKEFNLSPAEMRSRADALYKEASRLRKEADELDPPIKKKKTNKVEV